MAGTFRELALILRGLAALALAFCATTVPSQSPFVHGSSLTAPTPPVFPGPRVGRASVVAPTPATFAYACNVQANRDPGKAAGKTLAPGTAILDIDGCSQALLYLNAPARGHFLASFAVSDDATGASSVLRIFLIGPGGVLLRTADVNASKGAAQAVDFDVSGGVTLALTFPTPTSSYVYGLGLSGAARAGHHAVGRRRAARRRHTGAGRRDTCGVQ